MQSDTELLQQAYMEVLGRVWQRCITDHNFCKI